MGALLGKSIGEIRALPVPEFRRWQLFYILEPWGWPDREYRTAAVQGMIFNTNVEKKNRKVIQEFTRDMLKLIETEIQNEKRQERMKAKFDEMTLEERKQFIAQQLRGEVK